MDHVQVMSSQKVKNCKIKWIYFHPSFKKILGNMKIATQQGNMIFTGKQNDK